MRKSPKNIPEGNAPSGYSPWGAFSSPQRRQAPLPPRKGCHHVQLKYLRGCRNPYTPTTNTARVESGGIQGGPPPCAGGPGTRRFLAYLCLLSLREKVGRGAGRSARSWGAGAKSDDLLPEGRSPSSHCGCRGYQPRKSPGGLQTALLQKTSGDDDRSHRRSSAPPRTGDHKRCGARCRGCSAPPADAPPAPRS